MKHLMSIELAEEFLRVLESADQGEIPIVMANAETFERPYFDFPVFLVAGWRFSVFNDCASWDYIELVVTPAKEDAGCESFDFDNLPSLITDWSPDHLERWGLKEWERIPFVGPSRKPSVTPLTTDQIFTQSPITTRKQGDD